MLYLLNLFHGKTYEISKENMFLDDDLLMLAL